ncbi:hypothetical protein E2C01_097647 [Portunus trituberculatus]|uniref:Uncharacterized protein n=1 Tax=Portunus trituberculatus TaxID=210409 RepID=A0A5B7KAI9_PORTR|nr:hypothetical protein [Portunus trituberculatus]
MSFHTKQGSSQRPQINPGPETLKKRRKGNGMAFPLGVLEPHPIFHRLYGKWKRWKGRGREKGRAVCGVTTISLQEKEEEEEEDEEEEEEEEGKEEEKEKQKEKEKKKEKEKMEKEERRKKRRRENRDKDDDDEG